MDWIGAAVGAVGVVVAVLAHREAKKSNGLALRSQNTAKDAVLQAEEANRLAAEANDFAHRANSIAGQALDVTKDELLEHSWGLEIDRERWAVRNNSAHTAFDVTVLVTVDGQEALNVGVDEVARFDTVAIDLEPTLRQHRGDVARSGGQKVSGMFGGQLTYRSTFDPLPRLYTAHVIWVTSTGGFRHEQAVKKIVSFPDGAGSGALKIENV